MSKVEESQLQRLPAWPDLPLEEWSDTRETLHRWTQIVGKTRLALASSVNHWWHVPFYLSARGISTSAMPYRDRCVEVEFDFLDHVLRARTSDGRTGEMALAPKSVADFFSGYKELLRSLGIAVRIWRVPVEIEDVTPFDRDEAHASYDPVWATRFWRALAQADRVLQEFRGRFIGKCSPVHFFWGSFDLACTRFSGRTAPPHPGGVPNIADWVVREAYSHECMSAGWWPGSGAISEPAFYAYAYPEPEGFGAQPVRPQAAYYSTEMREFVLPYEAVRTADDPDQMLLEFLQSSYEAAARLANWDRSALERRPQAQG